MRLTAALFRRKLPVRRNHPINFNNQWHINRELKLQETGDRSTLTSMGIMVHEPNDVTTTPFLPYEEKIKYEPTEDIVKGPLSHDESHPNWRERPVHSFINHTYYPVNHQLDIAKNLTKSVEISEGLLPSRILDLIADRELLPDQDNLVKEVIKETQMYDATQDKLPFNYKVPYIGWHPVNDRMTSKMPYPVTMSWQRKLPVQYGIPIRRKTMNLTRGLFRLCDYLSQDYPSFLNRVQYENTVYRQYFERSGTYTRIYVDVPFSISAPSPLEPYSAPDITANMDLPDIYPMESHTGLWPTNIYYESDDFPILTSSCLAPFMHTVIDHYTSHIPGLANDDQFAARSLTLSFVAAMGQARLLYGPNVSGPLTEPVVIHFINTDGQKFYFSVFQLNTLDLNNETGVKNIFWHERSPTVLYDICDFITGSPKLEGYNSLVFKKILAMYLQGAK